MEMHHQNSSDVRTVGKIKKNLGDFLELNDYKTYRDTSHGAYVAAAYYLGTRAEHVSSYIPRARMKAPNTSRQVFRGRSA